MIEELNEDEMAHYNAVNYWRTEIVEKINEMIQEINELKRK